MALEFAEGADVDFGDDEIIFDTAFEAYQVTSPVLRTWRADSAVSVFAVVGEDHVAVNVESC